MSVPHFKKEGAQCRNVSEMRITDNTSKILNLQPNIQAFKETRKITAQINAKGGVGSPEWWGYLVPEWWG